uniref:Alpha-prime sex pheromone n=1 Tax=Sepia officinalis TaxID=6610 RepID=H9XQ26_SEPOF|nr:alpha-prime sex pheromone precursor [Sepia officinalis]
MDKPGKTSPLSWLVYVITALILVFFLARLEIRSNVQKAEFQHRAARLLVSVRRYYAAGPVFTRWGNNRCPYRSYRVYEGIMGGQDKTHRGGASNFLCLPRRPTWANLKGGSQLGGLIYGTQYKLYPSQVNGFGLFFQTHLKPPHNHDVPCAVCQVTKPATVLMIPGRKVCTPGWDLMYRGYLMSEKRNNAGRMTYVCVDKRPQVYWAGYLNENGATINHVESKCGSLPCPLYSNYKEVPCCVCSKCPI